MRANEDRKDMSQAVLDDGDTLLYLGALLLSTLIFLVSHKKEA